MMPVSKGFTLLELMMAIVLFSMISTAAYKLLASVTHAHEVTRSVLHELDKLQRAEIIVEQDLFQITGRPIVDETGLQPAMQLPGSDGMLMEFTRSGWQNPLQAVRSTLQRVAYAQEGSELIRYYWLTLDRTAATTPIRQVLLTGISNVKVRLLDQHKRWLTAWSYSPPPSADQNLARLPFAVELTIVHEKLGPMVTVVPLATYRPERAKPAGRHRSVGGGGSEN